ncbi:MAG: MerR family transcriptional regulator [Actinomycetota bacterium]|nr:MerR family transcriptional regulator [Actinomycetota bacterium]
MAELRTIGRLAEEAGVTRRAIRHYEQVGLLSPAARSDAGYRLYGLEAVRRLAFIRRAQLLGLTLAEIEELLDAEDDPCCGHIHPQLDRAVDDKLAEVRSRIAELSGLARQLESVRERGHHVEGDHCHGGFCVCGGSAPRGGERDETH